MASKDDLVRFGVAMEPSLMAELDTLTEARGCNRSELLRDLVRAEISRSVVGARVPAVATVTLIYNHHVRELSEKLTELQHELGEQVRSTMHVHLDHDHCLEVIVMRGRSDQLKRVASRMIGTRGVVHGGTELVAEDALQLSTSGRRAHYHEHDGHWHAHPHDPGHVHASRPSRPKAKRARR